MAQYNKTLHYSSYKYIWVPITNIRFNIEGVLIKIWVFPTGFIQSITSGLMIYDPIAVMIMTINVNELFLVLKLSVAVTL